MAHDSGAGVVPQIAFEPARTLIVIPAKRCVSSARAGTHFSAYGTFDT
jgi:hypothetical protein